MAVVINANVICCRGLTRTSGEIRQQKSEFVTVRLRGQQNGDYELDDADLGT